MKCKCGIDKSEEAEMIWKERFSDHALVTFAVSCNKCLQIFKVTVVNTPKFTYEEVS